MRFIPSLTVSSPSVHVTYPPASLLKFPPASLPKALSPPVSDQTFARPFNISPELYNRLLSVNYPVTIAILYATTVVLLSRLNNQRGNKPWAISQTRGFYVYVVLHNISLALFSLWVFLGMINAFRHSWPGLDAEGGVTGIVDAMCKINGPRGLGNAVTYNLTTSVWSVTNKVINLAGDLPDNTDVGRIWNEGLAFYGWLFYLSKFYEILDTMIVLAKGKKSSFLQTYHHTGAMLCMWAGIRYMSPPIWMFALANSGVHTLMYTYYALTALGIRVSPTVKRTLTTLQIAQFVVGVPYALAHLFIAYNVPVNTPYLVAQKISSAMPSITSSVSSAIASATASAGVGDWLKKIALRAAGEEGLAENVHNNQGLRFGYDNQRAIDVERKQAERETRYRMEYPKIHCLDTSGQAFAIWLNIMYLAPLTYLFVTFFVRSYLARTSSSNKHPSASQTQAIQKSGHDALKGIEHKIHEALSSDLSDMSPEIMQGTVEDTKAYIQNTTNTVKTQLSESYEYTKAQAKPKVDEFTTRVSETYGSTKAQAGPTIEDWKNKAVEGYENVKEQAAPKIEAATEVASEEYENAKAGFWDALKNLRRGSKQVGSVTAQKTKETASTAAEKASDAGRIASEKLQEGREKAGPVVREKAAQAADKAREGANVASDKANNYAGKASQKAQEGQERAEPVVKEKAAQASDKASEYADKANKSAKDGANKASDKIGEGKQKGGKKAQDVADKASDKVSDTAAQAEKKTKNVSAKSKDKAGDVAEGAKEGTEEASGKVKEGAGKAEKKVEEGKENLKPEAVMKTDNAKKSGKGAEKGDDEEEVGNAMAYEASVDEVEDEEEKEAEKKMQPDGV